MHMLESSSNRTGALDFQASADRYVPRDDDGGTLQDLEEAARRVERGELVPESLLVGNTDHHARNHSAFWSGAALSHTPAYDICPQARPTRDANQALVLGDGDRRSLLATCVAISNKFLLRAEDALELIDGLVDRLVAEWESVCDEARLGDATRRMLAGRQFLNPYAFQGYGPVPSLR